jgi:PAS domain S-box-containing protein
MPSTVPARQSLKTRITLTTLVIFIASLWSLSFYASRMLRGDMERLLGDQQYSTVSYMAAKVNDALDDRLQALQTAANAISPTMLGNPAAVQTLLEGRPLLQRLFSGGVLAHRHDGTAIVDVPRSTGRIGINYMDNDAVANALNDGRSTIGRSVMGRKLLAPVFAMAVPIRGPQGQVIGALMGVTDLGKVNFLDQIAGSQYGKTGGYMLVAPQHQLVVTASDKSRIMEAIPAPGINPSVDRFIRGDEGSGIVVNPHGVEVLASAKGVPVAGWYVVAAMPTAEAFEPVHAMQQRMLLATIWLTLLAGALTWWLLRRQLAPMLAAARALATLSDGSLPPRPLPITRHDEIGQLIGGLNRLLETLAQREEALKQSEAFTLAILNSVATEIAVLDHNGTILAVNEPWRRFALENSFEPGKPVPGTDVGANYLAVCQAGTDAATDDAVEACNGIRAVLDGHLPRFTVEYPCHSSQQQRWFSMTVTPLGMTAQGGAVIEHTDISERKRAEQLLRIAAIAFECQEGMIVTDANRVILRTNQSFTRIMGYTSEEVVGRTTEFMRSDRHPPAFYKAAWDTAREHGSWHAEVWHQRKNGEVFPQWLTSTAVKDALGNITHYVVTHIDITRQKLQEANRLANETAHRNTLVREVHHRIKNNLQGITGLLRQFAQKHPETADPMNQAIGQVQGISVIHGLQGRAVTSSVRLCELTGEIANEVQHLWQTPVTIDIPHLWIPCVIAENEAVPMALVLNELIVNAVKHGGKAQGGVRITLRKGLRPEVLQIKIVNAGQFAVDGLPLNTHRSGLQLITALMPRHGASLVREQHGEQVVTLLELEPPVISLNQKEPA